MAKKKGKGKKVEYNTSAAALAPFDVGARDIVATPLGVECTVVGVYNGALYLQWPGGLISPATAAPQKVHDKTGLEAYGYHRRPQSAHIQRSIDEREQALYDHRRYGAGREATQLPPLRGARPLTAVCALHSCTGKAAPPTAQFRLPLGPHGAQGTQQYAAYAMEQANPGSVLRPATAPAKKK
jgi:hypothetical protein